MNSTASLESKNQLDKIGIACSITCALHCLFAPMITLFVPTLTSYIGNEWIHISLLVLVIPTALISFFQSRKKHHSNKPILLGFIGLTFLLLAIVLEQFAHVEIENLEVILTSIGSFFLVCAHIFNIKYFNSLHQ